MWNKMPKAPPESLNMENVPSIRTCFDPVSRASESISSLVIESSPRPENVSQVLEKHQEMLWKARDLGMAILSDPNNPRFNKRTYGFKALTAALRDIQLGERMAWGIKDEVGPVTKIVTVGFGPPIIEAEN